MFANERLLLHRSRVILARVMDLAQLRMSESQTLQQIFAQIGTGIQKIAEDDNEESSLCEGCTCNLGLRSIAYTVITTISHFRACHRANVEEAPRMSRKDKNRCIDNADLIANRLYACTYLLLLREFPGVEFPEVMQILGEISASQEAEIPHLASQWRKTL